MDGYTFFGLGCGEHREQRARYLAAKTKVVKPSAKFWYKFNSLALRYYITYLPEWNKLR